MRVTALVAGVLPGVTVIDPSFEETWSGSLMNSFQWYDTAAGLNDRCPMSSHCEHKLLYVMRMARENSSSCCF